MYGQGPNRKIKADEREIFNGIVSMLVLLASFWL
jgi:hypothetical protein